LLIEGEPRARRSPPIAPSFVDVVSPVVIDTHSTIPKTSLVNSHDEWREACAAVTIIEPEDKRDLSRYDMVVIGVIYWKDKSETERLAVTPSLIL
jgi:hypothetical protein